MLSRQQRPRNVNTVLSIANLFLAAALLIAITMSGQAATVNPGIVPYAIVIDWLHLLAASLWIGGMMYIATNYLPVLRRLPFLQQARSLVTVLPYFTPLAIAGVLIMAVTGPFNAAFHMTSLQQFLSTAYGRALLIKIALIGGLLITSAIHIGILRPRLKKEYQKYNYVADRLQVAQAGVETAEQNRASTLSGQQAVTMTAEQGRATKLLRQQVRLREGRLIKKTQVLSRVLRWEPVLGVGVLICVGLMNVFAGTLSPIAVAQQPTQTGSKLLPINTSVRTTDGKFTVTLNVNPNRFGTNVFTVSAVDNSTGAPATNIGVSLSTTMLDMDMGTDTVALHSDGKGHFSGTGELSMPGNWQIRVLIRTPDAALHTASVKFVTPF
jgi:copper transport protein